MVFAGGTVGPPDHDTRDGRFAAEPEMEGRIGRRHEATAAAHDPALPLAAGPEVDPRSERLAIRRRADQANLDCVSSPAPLVDQQAQGTVDRAHHQVEVAVTVDIAGGDAPAGPERLDVGSPGPGDVAELE